MKIGPILLIFLFCHTFVISSDNSDNSEEDKEADQSTKYQSLDENQKQISNQLLENALKLLKQGKHNERKAYSLLEESAKLGNTKAKEIVAKSHLFGDVLPFNTETALKYFESIPTNSSSTAHLYLGFIYSMGLGVKPNLEKSLTHYRLSALLDNSMAKMAIAFRHFYGLGEEKNCEKAQDLYHSVATEVVDDSKEMGGQPLVYQILWKSKDTSKVNELDSDLINYFEFLAKGGDNNARTSLGQLYYYGGNGVQKDQKRAFNHFQKAAESGNGNALAFLGKFYLEGSSIVEQNFTKAYNFFKASKLKGNPIAMTELGLMYKHGLGVKVDFNKAHKLFAMSARQGWVEGIVQSGLMYLYGLGVSRDYRIAANYLNMAADSNHLLAVYNLGQLFASGSGVMKSCPKAVTYFKSVAERGVWSEILTEAEDNYKKSETIQSFIKFGFLSELGYSSAQINTAFIVETKNISLFGSDLMKRQNLALKYWTVSAMQGDSHSRLKVGDYYFYGLGTTVNYKKAVFYYKKASEFGYSAQGLFNLGYIYDRGLGVERNLKVAKLYYGMSAKINREAEIPVLLMKTRLIIVETIESSIKILNAIDLPKKWDIYLIFVLISVVICLILFIKLRTV